MIPKIRTKEAKFHDDRLSLVHDREGQAKFYWTVQLLHDQFTRAVEDRAIGKDVLELGCFSGDRTVELAAVAGRVVAIDISPIAVERTATRTRELGFDNVSAEVCDAENLSFDDQSFDLVVAAGVIHHVAVDRTIDQIYRVLRPGGTAMFREPLGHNPVINIYRSWTPDVRTDDEHPLMKSDLQLMQAKFDRMEIDYFGFFALGAYPLRHLAVGSISRNALNTLDRMIFNNSLLGCFCWQANIVLYKD